MKSHGSTNIKGTVTIRLNPELVLKFKAKCKDLNIRETGTKIEIFEQAMKKFIKEK
jgi:hypothetical protein